MIVSCEATSQLLWLPVYSINDRVHESTVYIVLGIVQILIYCVTGYVIVKTCSIFLKIKLFHENINILMAWFLCQWFEAILAKLVIIPYQTGMIQLGRESGRTYFNWWTDQKSEMLIVQDKEEIWSLYASSFFMWHYIWSAIFAPVVVGVERLCATYYIQDYEHARRRSIPIVLILATNMITIPYAYLVINDMIPFMVAYSQCVVNAAIVFFGYVIGYRINIVWRDRMEAQRIDHDRYSLARKFQVEENIRYLLLARKLVIVVVIYLSLSLIILLCLVLGVVKGYDTIVVHVLDNVILSAASVVSITWMFCSSTWKNAFLKGIPIIRRLRRRSSARARFTPNVSEVPEGEIYFIQLKNAWV